MPITAPLLHCGKSAMWVGLERQIDTSSQNLAAREAAFRHGEFIAAQARAQFFGLPRSRPSPRSRAAAGPRFWHYAGGRSRLDPRQDLSMAPSWTPNMWGRVRLVESNVANAQARAADLASTRLVAQGALASDYLQLRIADALKRLLHATANEHAKSVRITRSQHVVGIASALDFSDPRRNYAARRCGRWRLA